ncbi:MAG: DOMON-like domain-containing protein [Pseudomonadota bacterium]
MTFQLTCHPDTPTETVRGIAVSHDWHSHTELQLRYHVDVPLEQLFIPDLAGPERMDDLWHTTCFELFLRQPGAAPYCEFNLSPSSRWAAYGFTDFREGAHDMDVPKAPQIGLDASDSHFALEAILTLPENRVFPQLAAAISAIIVMNDGHKSYWGYRHPEGKPEFHHVDCFAARLTPPEAA